METLTLPLADVLGTSPPTTALPSLAEQLDALRQQHHAALDEIAALRVGKAALEARMTELEAEVRELRARLGVDSSNSSRPPSPDLPQAAAKNKAKRKRAPTGRNRGGQPGHAEHHRVLQPAEQVTQIMVVRPEACRHCGQPFPEQEPRRPSRTWRHQVVDLELLTVRVTEYQMQVPLYYGNRSHATVADGAGDGIPDAGAALRLL